MTMDDLARKRAKLFRNVSKDRQQPGVSFRRFYRLAKKPDGMPRGRQRRMVKVLWKAVGKKPLGTTKRKAK